MIGGLEAVVEILSGEFAAEGHEVVVITDATDSEPDTFPFKVLRKASWFEQWQTIRQSDVFVHANVSLWGVIPWLMCGPSRPLWVATHHGWYSHHNRSRGWLDRIKIWMAEMWAVNISVSSAVDHQLELKGHVVPNPYRNDRFRRLKHAPKTSDLVFLGRLVSDKGADLLLQALAILKDGGERPSLTIIGRGPEQDSLKTMSQQLELSDQVSFAGAVTGEPLVELLNQHRVLVVPSRWDEPFGLVALEGIACGCIVVGSSGGGLAEAIGSAGYSFQSGSAVQLAECLTEALVQQEIEESATLEHLDAHNPSTVAKQYLSIIKSNLTHLPHG